MNAAARNIFLRAFWWLVFASLVLGGLPYLFTRPPNDWLSGPIGKVAVLLASAAVCRALAVRWPQGGVSALLMLLIGASPWFLGASYNAFSVMAVANLPLVLLGMLWGWRGAGAGIAVALVGFASQPHRLDEALIAAMLLAGSGLIGGFVHRLTDALERANRQLEANNATLARSASSDAMTGLGNRRALVEEFPGLQRQGPLVLTLWDLNDLKLINDRHGHLAGDRYILEFVEAAQRASRGGDRYYRIGGDEFVGLHPKLEDGRVVRDRVLERFATVAVGWVRCDDRGLDHAILEADIAMYEHKAKTKTGVHEPALDAVH